MSDRPNTTRERQPYTCLDCGNVFDRAVTRCCPVCRLERSEP